MDSKVLVSDEQICAAIERAKATRKAPENAAAPPPRANSAAYAPFPRWTGDLDPDAAAIVGPEAWRAYLDELVARPPRRAVPVIPNERHVFAPPPPPTPKRELRRMRAENARRAEQRAA